MPRVGQLDMVAANVVVPRGLDAYWALIKELDTAGPWSIRQVEMRTNVDRRSVSRFVQNLRAAGYAEVVEEQENNGAARRKMYRLTRRPMTAPLFRSDGSERPEPVAQLLWRTMKMASIFTPSELVELASATQPVNLGTARTYVADLAGAGILAITRRGVTSGGEENTYRLVQNLGLRAPRQLKAKMIFDPNSNRVIGSPVARAVAP